MLMSEDQRPKVNPAITELENSGRKLRREKMKLDMTILKKTKPRPFSRHE